MKETFPTVMDCWQGRVLVPRARNGQNSPEVLGFSIKNPFLGHTSGLYGAKLARGVGDCFGASVNMAILRTGYTKLTAPSVILAEFRTEDKSLKLNSTENRCIEDWKVVG